MGWKCEKCGNRLDAHDKYCTKCGEKAVFRCKKCMKKLDDGEHLFCHECGERVCAAAKKVTVGVIGGVVAYRTLKLFTKGRD